MKTMENKKSNTYFQEFGRIIEDWNERHEAHMREKYKIIKIYRLCSASAGHNRIRLAPQGRLHPEGGVPDRREGFWPHSLGGEKGMIFFTYYP